MMIRGRNTYIVGTDITYVYDFEEEMYVNRRLRQRLERNEDALDVLLDRNAALREKLRGKDDEVEKLSKQLKLKTEETETLKTKLAAHDQTIKELENKIRNWETIETKKARIQLLESELKALTQEATRQELPIQDSKETTKQVPLITESKEEKSDDFYEVKYDP